MFENAMDLTSYERVRNYLDITKDDLPTRRLILDWISTVSARVQDYLQRNLLIGTYQEYQNVIPGQFTFVVNAYPIQTISAIDSDSLGLYQSPVTIQNYFVSPNGDAINLNYQIAAGLKGIRYTYTGGLTAHATQSIYILSGVTGLVAEQYIEGQSSMAVGKIKLVNGTAVSIEVLIGRFQVLETLKAYATCDLSGPISAFSGVTIVSATRLCLAEAHPLIVKATEIEIRFMKQHKLDFENTKTGKDGTDRRQSSKNNAIEYELQPESEALLYRYKRLTV